MTNNTYLVADLFCGAGGSSTGAKNAIAELGGEMDLVAINHWNTAIATHQSNHPTARHLVEDVSIVDPEEVVEGGYLDILMASPECKYHSRARGGKPIHDQGRMNPWAVHNWLTKLDVRCVLVENVPEFVDWGPLLPDGRPDKSQKSKHFEAWFLTFGALGYQAEWRMLNAADYGDATTRTRFFLLARKDGPVMWPEPSHAKEDSPMFPGRLPWRGAKEIIDWSNPGRSLLDDKKYRAKPLSEKTRRRIARGLERFGGPLAPLYIRLLDLPDPEEPDLQANGNSHTEPFILNRNGENGSDQSHSVDDPMPTATTRGAGYLIEPFVLPHHRSAARSTGRLVPTVTTRGPGYLVEPEARPFHCIHRENAVPRSIDEPLYTFTTENMGFLIKPELKMFLLGQQSQGAPRSIEDPVPTIAAGGAISLLKPMIIRYNGQSNAEDVDAPLSTVLTNNKHGLVKPVLVEYYSGSDCADVDRPLPTVTTKDRHGLVIPSLIELSHGNGDQGEKGNNRRVHSVDDPVPSITTSPGLGLANPALIEVNHVDENEADGTGRVHSVGDPLKVVTTKRGMGLASPILVQSSQTGGNGIYARSVDQPLATLTTLNDMNLIIPDAQPYITPNFGERDNQPPRVHSIEEPVPSVTSRGAGNLVTPVVENVRAGEVDPRRVVFLDKVPYFLDIRFRMLQNTELAKAMGFDDEESEYEFVGNIGEVTKQIGNAVPVHLAAALVKAALGSGNHAG